MWSERGLGGGTRVGPGLSRLSTGPQKAEGIVEWLRRRVGPSATRLEDEEGVQALMDAGDVVVIGFFQVSWMRGEEWGSAGGIL